MKTIITICLLTLHLVTGKSFDKTSVYINEDGKTYEFVAVYPARDQNALVSYMDKSLDVSTSLKNTVTDAELTLDNKYTFYMKQRPGELKLKFDKRKNTPQAYQKLKQMCEGLKDLINHKS